MGKTLKLAVLTGLVASTIIAAGPVGAEEEDTSFAFTNVATTASTVNVEGTLTFGADATGNIQVGSSPAGSSLNGGVIPDGLDLGDAFIRFNPANRSLTFTINVHNMPPNGSVAPTFVYNWQIMVDGVDNNRYLSAGHLAGFPPPTGNNFRYWSLCTSTPEGYTCPQQALGGTMDAEGATIVLPMSTVGAQLGSVVGTGAALPGGAGSITSTWNPFVLLFYNTGGDSMMVEDYRIPGEVSLGIGPASTPPAQIPTNITATVGAGATPTFTGSLIKPTTPGEYQIVAKTCFGASMSQTCVLGSEPLTIE